MQENGTYYVNINSDIAKNESIFILTHAPNKVIILFYRVFINASNQFILRNNFIVHKSGRKSRRSN